MAPWSPTDSRAPRALMARLGHQHAKFTVPSMAGRAPTIAAAILVAAIVGDVGATVIRWASPGNVAATSPATGRTRAIPGLTRNSTEGGALDAIGAASLFGRADGVPAESVVPAATLVLTATIATADPAAGYAIIGNTAPDAHLVRSGAEISPGARLAAVYVDYVIVVRSGDAERVSLPRALSAQVVDARAQPERLAAAVATATSEEGPRKFKPPTVSDGLAVVNTLNLRPVMSDGRRVGLRVASPQPKVLAALGLTAGDIVVEMGGIALDGSATTPTPTDLLQLINSGRGVVLTVDRGGARAQVVIDSARASEAARIYRAANPT